jgi:hypothetical protein
MYIRPTGDQTFVKIDNFYLFSEESGKIADLQVKWTKYQYRGGREGLPFSLN